MTIIGVIKGDTRSVDSSSYDGYKVLVLGIAGKKILLLPSSLC